MAKRLPALIKSSPGFRISLVILIISALTVIFTYPLIRYIEYRSIGHLDDPKLNMWIINWGCHQLLNQPSKLYQANIFYPYKNSLAFSDNLVGLSILALPVYLFNKNPILIYNITLLVSFILIGVGVYLLVYRLTGNYYAAVMAAIIYNFCPGHLLRYSQIQIFTTQWTIFTLLYLHKFIEKSSLKNILLFSLFFTFQSASGAYNAVYQLLLVGIGIIYFTIAKKKYREHLFFPKLALLLLLCFSLSFILFLPYLQVHKEYGMVRSIEIVEQYSPNWQSYFAVPTNLYQKIAAHSKWFKNSVLKQAKAYLFPGIIPIVLAGLSVTAFSAKRNKNSKRRKDSSFLNKQKFTICSEQLFYLIIGVLFIIFSLGTKFPLYKYLYKSLLIFRLIRVPSRMFLITILSLSILSGYSIAKLLNSIRNKHFVIFIGILIPLLFFVESTVFPPTPWPMMPYNNVPPIYLWLAQQPGKFAIIEFPFDRNYANSYMLFSAFHWKNLVNGRSGFEPKDYLALERKLKAFPHGNTLNRLEKILGLKYIVVHPQLYSKKERVKILEELQELQQSKKIILVKQIGEDYVYGLP